LQRVIWSGQVVDAETGLRRENGEMKR